MIKDLDEVGIEQTLDIVREVLRAVLVLQAENKNMAEKIKEMEWQLEMSCQNPDPNCDCPGCSFADDMMADEDY